MPAEAEAPGAEADGLAGALALSPLFAQLPVNSTVWPTCAARSTPDAAVSLTFLLAASAGAADAMAPPSPFLTLVSSKLLALVPAATQPVILLSLPARSA